MTFPQISLDQALKLVQIMFYIIGAIVTILTYRSAKRGLLNTVNTEYQKRVMDRLRELSDELASEFNEDSPNYWFRTGATTDVVNRVNEVFLERKDEILKRGEFPPGIPVSKDFERMLRLITNIKTDPFIPRKIRNLVVDFLEKRASAIHQIYNSELREYATGLAKGMLINDIENNCHWVHNKINARLYEAGFGIGQVKSEVDNLRLAIQDYFEAYDPLPKRKK